MIRRPALAFAISLLITSPLRAETVSFDCVAEPAQSIEVGSPVTGILSEMRVGRGDRVAPGDVLARLDSTVEEANVALAQVQAEAQEALASQLTRLTLAEAALDRARQLLQSGSVTSSRIEELQAAVEIARADLETERHRKRVAEIELERQRALLDRLTILSPISGFVTGRLLSVGEFVRQDSALLTLVQTDPLFVEAYVPVTYWGRIVPGLPGTVTLEQPAGTEREASVVVVDPVFDAASGTFGMRLALDNPAAAIPAGQRCTVSFSLPERG